MSQRTSRTASTYSRWGIRTTEKYIALQGRYLLVWFSQDIRWDLWRSIDRYQDHETWYDNFLPRKWSCGLYDICIRWWSRLNTRRRNHSNGAKVTLTVRYELQCQVVQLIWSTATNYRMRLRKRKKLRSQYTTSCYRRLQSRISSYHRPLTDTVTIDEVGIPNTISTDLTTVAPTSTTTIIVN